MRKLLLVDDDPGILRGLKWSLEPYELITAGSRAEALELFRRHRPPVVTLDLGLPPAVDDASEGLAALDAILALEPNTKVIVVSGNDDRTNAVVAVGRGAADFYHKPIDAEILSLLIARAFAVFDLEEENRRLRRAGNHTSHGILTSNPAMQDVCLMLEKVAASHANVLLLGESGTGKELAARALHRASERRDGPFIAINCAAIPEHLLESELFGHEKGAFTGADRQVKGKVEMADGGTLLLDEIGDMPASLQAKLLRFLQERQIERVGGRKVIAVDTRIVSATHQNLQDLTTQGRFRDDLYFRLAQITINIPALRERGDDSVLLARQFVDRFAIEQKRKAPTLTADAIDGIRRYAWPGNIRELENRVQRAVILASNERLTAADLGLDARDTTTSEVQDAAMPLRRAREHAEARTIQACLERVEGNLTAAAKILEVSRPTLYNLMRQHGISLSSEESS
jgi:two-component system, NtrC family, response regulator